MSLPTPTRAAGLQRLADFLPRAGVAYARNRNLDVPGHPHVSGLGPYLRHRIVTEQEVLRTVLNAHGATAASKFIDEVFWRTYWKGWLQMRPGVWDDYRAGLARALSDVQSQAGLRRAWQQACTGQTGLDCFDHWARELAETGYLHNHARMWFASIWIFTLRLPWQLGADFFLRHLLDGDPASNTLSWRWVGGLQTPGKTYLARSDNIARNTEGRFAPVGLSPVAPALPFTAHPVPRPLRTDEDVPSGGASGLLLTEEDMFPDGLMANAPVAIACVLTTAARSPLEVSPMVRDWVGAAMGDVAARIGARVIAPDMIADWAAEQGLDRIVLADPTVGPTRDALTSLDDRLAAHRIRLIRRVRPLDSAAWPKATQGFFRFRESIPRLLAGL